MVTRTFSHGFVSAFVFALGAALPARAAEPAPESAGASQPEAPAKPAPEAIQRPALHHAPRSVATAHTALAIDASITHPHRVRRAVLVYRSLRAARRDAAPGESGPSAPALKVVEFLRGSTDYVAVVPASEVGSPGLEYAIELELVDGTREAVFASRRAPFRVFVSDDLMDVRERIALLRLEGRRSVVSSFFEYASFGRSRSASPGGADVNDWYYRVEAAYTYRPLRVIDEFSVHVGVVRGSSPKPGAPIVETSSVGLNYAAPSVRFRLSDVFRLETSLLASVTEVGFAVGGGASFDVGDPYGSKWRLGFESIQTFGNRIFSQVDIQAAARLRLSPIIELTDMPHADRFGVRLVGEALYVWPNGVGVAVRAGYQARDAASGGPSGGLRLLWGF